MEIARYYPVNFQYSNRVAKPCRRLIALWRGLAWSIWLLFGGILLLQIVPYTLFRSYFILKAEDGQVLNGLLGTEILLLGILILLLLLKK